VLGGLCGYSWVEETVDMGALLTGLWVAIRSGFGLMVGWKAIILVTLLSYASIMLYNLYCTIIQEIINFAIAASADAENPGGITAGAMNAAGLAGYLVSKLRLVECFNFAISTIVLKWTLVKIPFIKW
jgi:hypothetical protein